jgi:hypothetical protein
MPDVQDEEKVTPELSEEGRAAVESLVEGILKEELSARRAEVRKAAQQRNFRNGFQHIWWDKNSNTFMNPEASGQQLPRFMDVYNIYTPHWRSFVSILSQNPPGINFVPDDLQRSTDVTAAGYAEKMRHRVDRLVHMKDRQAEASGFFCTDGRTLTWTRVDAKGKLRVTMHGVLESKVPIFARKMERWGYAVLSEEVDLWEAKEDHPDFADDITADAGSTSESSFERFARLGILANKRGSESEALKNLVTEHNAWIRPSRYRKAAEGVRAELKKAFPDGVHVTMISGKAVATEPQKIEDALRCEWPAPGQGSSRPSLLHDLIPIQEAFNDALNMLREHFEFSIPATWVTDTVDSEALAEQRSAPGVIHQITVPANASISDLVMQEQVAQLPPELVSNIDRLLSLAQFVTGDLPSLSGEGDPHSETAQGQKMLSDQAKGQLSPAWGGLQWLFAGTYEIGVVLAAKMLSDRDSISIQGGTGQQQFNPAAILDGTFGCYPNTDSSFPETMADQRASLQAVLSQLGQGEQGQAIVYHPDNLKLIKQYSGLKDLVIPGAEARDKQLREIEQMLQEPPVPDTNSPDFPAYVQAMQQFKQQQAIADQVGFQRHIQNGGDPKLFQSTPIGQAPQPPLTSSVQIGKYDYNQPELDKCIEWLSSNACFEELQKGNSQGVQNVQLHADLHAAAIAKAASANAPQQTPMSISGAFKDLDPATKVQVLQRDGYNPDPTAYTTDQVVDQQNVAADTQNKAAGAQHKAVLAAKEAVAPIQKTPPPPDQSGIKEGK